MFPMIGEFCQEMQVKTACISLRFISNWAANDMGKLAVGKGNLSNRGKSRRNTYHVCLGNSALYGPVREELKEGFEPGGIYKV